MRNGEVCRWALKLKTKSSAVPVVKEMFTGSGSVGLLDKKKTKQKTRVLLVVFFLFPLSKAL